MRNLKQEADANLAALVLNPYPGRGIIVGLDETGENLVQVYWIMGRSENSRNRIFSCQDGRLFTEAADPSKVKDPSLIIYNAMRESSGMNTVSVVSNGHQTDDVVDNYREGRGLYETMSDFSYEPDEPNFTPRITAISYWVPLPFGEMPAVLMSILRKSPWGNGCDRHQYEFNDIGRGFGYCLTTYSGNGDPLPSFRGEPYLLPLERGQNNIADTFFGALNHYNRISLAVKFISKGGRSHIVIVNKFSKV